MLLQADVAELFDKMDEACLVLCTCPIPKFLCLFPHRVYHLCNLLHHHNGGLPSSLWPSFFSASLTLKDSVINSVNQHFVRILNATMVYLLLFFLCYIYFMVDICSAKKVSHKK